MIKSTFFRMCSLFLVLSLVVLFAGCGGGSGDDDPVPALTYSISGTVSGDVAEGVTITLSGAGSDTATTDADGNYTFSDVENGSYTITASMTDYSFTPASKAVTVDGADATVDFVSSEEAATTYKLFPDGFLTLGYTESYDLTGSSTSGATYTSTLDVTTLASTTFLGDAAIPVEHEVYLENTVTHSSGTLTSTDYHTTDLSDHEYLGFNNANYGNTVAGPSTSIVPQSASIGDSGNVGTYTYSNGYIQTLSWELTDAGGGYANLVLSAVITTGAGATRSTETTTYVIDEDGVRQSVSMVLYSAALGTVTLTTE